MNISQLLTKLKTLVYSKSETDSLLGGKASSSHTHTKSQITDFPTIPSKTSQLTNDSGFITGVSWNNVSGKPSTFTPSSHTHTKSQITDFPSLATVATSGSYTDLSNKPTIPSNTNQLTNGAGYITSSGSCNYANSAGNSDTLDSYHEYSFLRYRGNTSTSGEGTLWAQIGIKDYNNALPDGLSDVYQWGEVVSLAGGNGRFDIYCSHNSSNGNGLYYRSGWANDKKAWRRFIDSANIGSQSVNYATSAGSASSCTGNAATATKATYNANGKELVNSIIKGLSVSGRTITYTKLDGTTGTLTTQDTTYSSLPANGGTSTATAYMNQHSTITYGVNRLQYYNVSTSTTSGATSNANPTNDWYYHLLMSHANSAGYYGDLAMCFHSNTLAFRRISSGSDNGWCYLVKNGRTIVSGYEVYVG